ncbi:MAG: DUF488 domain-containing protein [Galactobacillus timonensis]|uniref:DUF488 domain-containing protein n=1 Tax=Galactobacillus timonensis TaxID=2041840 RepID=UPI0023F2836E|nr:DUF488 domain-containing protein [Galactobacillus timonensis]MCI6067396.1 DUF488 domain-containing protein [Galactobacillus timonensis]MCI6753844.1 DUF488 domain-containing protein [Galactobacillus timonensis]MDD7087373.1 DUF488 domain-containing protein [Galactobacillus timonensis]MDY5222824.1 DUF488 domain-containing protein [Lachnospiraceae bacterium]
MNLFTLSAYETTAEQFFETLKKQNADLVLDVRLRNTNQLCGFTKEKDLAYFVHNIVGAQYVHDLRFAPDSDLLDAYTKHVVDWNGYRQAYLSEMEERNARRIFTEDYRRYASICILGTATVHRRSHSEALLEYLKKEAG